MDFELSEELKMIQSLARDFVEGQLKPLEREILGKAADLSDARAYLPAEKEAELIKQTRDLGLWGLGVPEELGGAGLNTLGICLVEEELANTVVPFNLGDVTPILYDCNKEQRDKYFQPAFNNEKRPYLALMENSNKDLADVQMKAENTDGKYILNGSKLSLSRPGDDYFAVAFGKTDKGVTCFLVDKDTPGFNVSCITERKGWLSRVRVPLILVFENCKISAGNMLGEEGKAFRLGEKWLPRRRIVRGARSVGIARRLLEEAAAQAQAASAFGQPVAKRTSVRAGLADIAANIHAARLMVYEAACAADAGKNILHQASLVKLQTSQMLRSVVDMVSHIFNGPSCAGLTVDRLCRHVLETNLQEFTLEKQRNVIAGDVLKGFKV
jgi:acyl-CoA dehydrogenase